MTSPSPESWSCPERRIETLRLASHEPGFLIRDRLLQWQDELSLLQTRMTVDRSGKLDLRCL